MTPLRQTAGLTALAVVAFLGLRALPDTQCSFLHADHQPVVVDGLEFCGVNEEANFYSPKALGFPVGLKVILGADGATGEVRLIKEDGHPYYPHEISISHTQKVHLHLRSTTGTRAYAHIHPEPTAEGVWQFKLPPALQGAILETYVDFIDARTGRVVLAQAVMAAGPPAQFTESPPRNRILALEVSSTQTGSTAMLRFKLAGPEGAPLKLRPIMGALGHTVIFSAERTEAGYAHVHPTLEGEEYAPNPTLAFRVRLPAPGTYDLWLNLNDGAEELLRTTLVVTP